MSQVACSRCFRLFEAEDAHPGRAPLCPGCAARVRPGATAAPPAARRAPASSGRPVSRRGVLWSAAAVAAALAVAAGGYTALRARRAPARREPTPVDDAVARWTAEGLAAAPARGADRAAVAAARVVAGRAALEADVPVRTAEALRAFRDALAADPGRLEAIAGAASAFADSAGEEPEPEGLRELHELVRWATDRAPQRGDLRAAWARLLLLSPGEANAAEALESAKRAAREAPGDSSVALALGLAGLDRDAAAAARTLEEAIAGGSADRRLLVAAARARWRAGDPRAALGWLDRRLALDPGRGASALRAEIETACGRIDAARATLQRWGASDATSALPALFLARIAYQIDGDLGAARRLLDEALPRAAGDVEASRIQADRAAVLRAFGDAAGAAEAVAAALRRVPASAPARFQAAADAFRREDAAALREDAGVVGGRCGPQAAALLAARSAELSATRDDAVAAWTRIAEASPRDPAALLVVAGALVRLGEPAGASGLVARALARDPEEAALRRGLVECWDGPAALSDAAQRLGAAGGEGERARLARTGAALAELLLGHTVQAEAIAARATQAANETAPLVAVRAQIALARGDARRAEALARSVAARRGTAARAVQARALEALGRPLEAERAFRAALAAEPDLATARLGLARLLAARGARAEAGALLEELRREQPDVAAARGALLALAEAPASPPGRPLRAGPR